MTLIALLHAGALVSTAPAHADVNVGTGVAPPLRVVSRRLPGYRVPGSPVLYRAREPYTLFVYHGRYYSLHAILVSGPGSAGMTEPRRGEEASEALTRTPPR